MNDNVVYHAQDRAVGKRFLKALGENSTAGKSLVLNTFSSDHITDPSIATVTIPILVLIELRAISCTFEAFAAIGTFHCVLDAGHGPRPARAPSKLGLTGSGKVRIAEIPTRFRQFNRKARFKRFLQSRYALNLLGDVGFDTHLTATASQSVPNRKSTLSRRHPCGACKQARKVRQRAPGRHMRSLPTDVAALTP